MKESVYSDDDRQYLQMMQGIIERMASNSANCKSWMVTIVAAMLALQCSIKELNGWILLAILPIFLFWYLDTFYLHLERGMRNRERMFINILQSSDEKEHKDALYYFKPKMIKKKDLKEEEIAAGLVATNDRFLSKSIAPFYGGALVGVIIISIILNWV